MAILSTFLRVHCPLIFSWELGNSLTITIQISPLNAWVPEEGLHGCLHVQLAFFFLLVIHHENTTLLFQEPLFARSIWRNFWSCLQGFLSVLLLCSVLEFVSRQWAHTSKPFLSHFTSVTCHKPSLPLFSVWRAIISSSYVYQVGEQAFLLSLPLVEIRVCP